MTKETGYEKDFLLWTQQQAELLKNGHWAELDIEHLVEELEALGRSEQKELGSYLQVLLMHLLKCQYQPERRTKSWDHTLNNCRDKIQDCLEDIPSLQRYLHNPMWRQKYYRRACRDAAKETQKSIETFPDFSCHVEKVTQNLTPHPPSLRGNGEKSKSLSSQERDLERGFPDTVKS